LKNVSENGGDGGVGLLVDGAVGPWRPLERRSRLFFRYFLKISAILPVCRFKTAARFGKIVDILMTRTGGRAF